MPLILTLFENESSHRFFVKFLNIFQKHISLLMSVMFFKEQSLKHVLECRDGYLSHKMPHIRELTFAMKECQLYYASVIH